MIYKSYLIEKDLNVIKENLTLFYGENLGLKQEFKKLIRLDNKEAEILKFNQEEIVKNENIILNQFSTASLFNKKKIFIIEQANDKLLSIIQQIEKVDLEEKFFIFAEILDKKSKLRSHFEKSKKCSAVPCYADNELTIKNIILKKLKNFKNLSTYNLNLIINNIGNDRIKLNNELDKIILYFQDRTIITEKLEIILNVKTNDNFNLLKDEALLGNKVNTNNLLSETTIDTEKNVFYLTLLNQRLNQLGNVFALLKSKKKIEEAVSLLKPPVFWKDKPNLIAQAKKWDTNKINFILRKTYDLEINIKSNSMINKSLLMKQLLLDICIKANAS